MYGSGKREISWFMMKGIMQITKGLLLHRGKIFPNEYKSLCASHIDLKLPLDVPDLISDEIIREEKRKMDK